MTRSHPMSVILAVRVGQQTFLELLNDPSLYNGEPGRVLQVEYLNPDYVVIEYVVGKLGNITYV